MVTLSSHLRRLTRSVLRRCWPALYERPLQRMLARLDLLKTGLAIERMKSGGGDPKRELVQARAAIARLQEIGQANEDRIRELEISTAQLEKLAAEDPLTGLVNRRGLNLKFEAVWSALSRTMRHIVKEEHRRRPMISALLIDIDFFKKINDRYGHEVGDQVLAGVAMLMTEHLGHRPEDILCRFGGEEFLVVLPHANARHACSQATLFATAVKQTAFLKGETVTLSIGITELELSPEVSPKEMLRQLYQNSDRAMYVAKSTGRDQLILYQEGMTQ